MMAHSIGIQMNQKELTKIVMMLSKYKNFSLHGLYKNISALQGLMCHLNCQTSRHTAIGIVQRGGNQGLSEKVQI